MSDPFENPKKIKAFDKLWLVFSNNKIIIKDLEEPDQHYTMLFKDNGIVDIHKTKEGSKKEYESIAKYDLVKTVQNILGNPKEMEDAFMQFLQTMKEVNFEESEYEHLAIANMKTKEELADIVKKEKKGLVIPIESLQEFQLGKSVIAWKEAKGKIKDNALVFDKEKPAGYIFKKGVKYFYLPVADLMDTPVMQFFNKMMNPEKVSENNN